MAFGLTVTNPSAQASVLYLESASVVLESQGDIPFVAPVVGELESLALADLTSFATDFDQAAISDNARYGIAALGAIQVPGRGARLWTPVLMFDQNYRNPRESRMSVGVPILLRFYEVNAEGGRERRLTLRLSADQMFIWSRDVEPLCWTPVLAEWPDDIELPVGDR